MKLFFPMIFFLFGCLALGLVVFMQKLPQRPLGPNSTLSDTDNEHPVVKGLQLSPRSFGNADFTEFFQVNQQLDGKAVGWTGSVSDLSKSDGAPVVLQTLGTQYGFTPVLSVQSFDRTSGKLLPDFVSGKKAILDFVKKYKPKYFGMGVEVNILNDLNLNEYDKYVKLFNDYANEIHQASKITHIYPIFQLEQLKGYKGGLFGGYNDTKIQSWDLLQDFPTADFIGLTTYPTLIYKTPQDIPSNYYKEIFTKTTKRIIFSEIGWFHNAKVKGWESSEAEQESFLSTFNGQITGERVTVKLWSFLYDSSAIPAPFNNMGLRNSSKKSTDKLSPAEIYWKKM